MNREVAKVIGEQFGHKSEAKEEKRGKVHPAVAKLLSESVGVQYGPQDLMEAPAEAGAAMNPLGAPGDAPMANPNVPADQQGMGVQQAQPDQQQTTPQQKRDMPRVKLKSSVNRITTLQDLRDKMNEVTQRITTIDTLTQTLMGDNTTDNDLQKHKATLKGAVDQLASSVRDLQNAFKD